jgi:MscS family membrane protein
MNSELFINLKNWWAENNIVTYLVSIALFLVIALALRNFIARILTGLLFKILPENFRSRRPDFNRLVRKPLVFIISVILVLIARLAVRIPNGWETNWIFSEKSDKLLEGFLEFGAILSITWLVLRVIDFMGIIFLERNAQAQTKMGNSLIPFMRELVKIVVVILGIFVALGTVFHLNVASIIAGLGIGGLAVALAGKETLENLFASFTIFIDQPFMVGDFVQVNGIKGTVERVGFRSTRIRSLDRTYVTLPNKMMVDTALDNITERSASRVSFQLQIDSHTEIENIEVLCKAIKALITGYSLVLKDPEPTVRFNEFGDGSLKILVLYFLDTRSDTEINKAKEYINLGIMNALKETNVALFVLKP